MPFWAGMLTERQHLHPELEPAIRQAAWDLYFRHTPVCAPPDFVTNPGIDLDDILRGQPILILVGKTAHTNHRALPSGAFAEDIDARIRGIKKATKRSWPDLLKAALSLQGKPHKPWRRSSGHPVDDAEPGFRARLRRSDLRGAFGWDHCTCGRRAGCHQHGCVHRTGSRDRRRT